MWPDSYDFWNKASGKYSEENNIIALSIFSAHNSGAGGWASDLVGMMHDVYSWGIVLIKTELDCSFSVEQ